MIITIKTSQSSYDITLENGALNRVNEIIDLKGNKAFIVTDSLVPRKYSEKVKQAFENSMIFTFEAGEKNKNFETFHAILTAMVQFNMNRKDCVIAVGGGVTGDMAGFAAACYMRGIDFYNIPTTLLSQVDSSIGGKTAIDLGPYKNTIGAFYQPKAVIIDPEVLETLDTRHVNNGLSEALKMGATLDKSLFDLIAYGDYKNEMITVIEKSLQAKRKVVEEDEKEQSVRKSLNFGHTIGHGIESSVELGSLLHGECVGLGMLLITTGTVHQTIKKGLERIGLPVEYQYDKEKVLEAMTHDKKSNKNSISTVRCDEIGTFRFEEMTLQQIAELI